MKIGITGQAGFVGTHLYNYLGLDSNVERISFEDRFFESEALLRSFVKQCDVIVHLAAMNRHEDPQVIYQTNMRLTQQLIGALEAESVKPHVIFSSSTQEALDNPYGRSKLEGRNLLENWAKKNDASFSGLIVPNVFGEFSRPNYNTFVATFSHKLIHGERPEIHVDSSVKLIYVGSLCRYIQGLFVQKGQMHLEVPFDFERKVSDILSLFERFKEQYVDQGIIPYIEDIHEIHLFNTFRSYMNYSSDFPRKLIVHADERGAFVETIKLGMGGQVSFSTTLPGITRGNHYHTRKIERFTVIRGKAQIQLRKIGTDEIINLFLDGSEPAYVDIPVWYTHNIKNIGEEELYTQFWINEWYDAKDSDTFFEGVE